MLNVLAQLRELNMITAADYYFAKLIADKTQGVSQDPTQQELVILLAALCHQSYLQGNSCLYLDNDVARHPFGLGYKAEEVHLLATIKQNIADLPVAQWQSAVENHLAFTTQPLQKAAPFVLQGNAVYLYRAWQDEQTVVNYFKSAVKKSQISVSFPEIKQILDQYFPERENIDWQKIAVATALIQPFTLIAGGPGTGKTYTVARLLAAIQQWQLQQKLPPLRIRLAAPTGKAAARLKESIDNSLAQMPLPEEVRKQIITESETLHRLLGVRPFKDAVRFHEQNPLPLDLLIVDEASMIDLAMMAKLLRALPEQARLILLGDKDQLASVEAGAILAELGTFFQSGYSAEFATKLQQMTGAVVPISEFSPPIRQHLALLTKSTRFDSNSPVGQVAKEINAMQAEQSWNLLAQSIPLVEYDCDDSSDEQAYRQRYLQHLLQSAVENYAIYLAKLADTTQTNATPTDAELKTIFATFNSVRYLTALRAGDFGVESLNEKIAEKLRQKGWVQFKYSRDWFNGKPIMVTQNDVNVGLYNGDIGLYIGNRVYFERENGFKSVSINRVPTHELAFAMTIHKSQGSEFAQTVVVLPPEYSPILTKELLYTAVTRAKPNLMVFSSREIWQRAVRNPIKRQSGIGRLLSEIA
ncbi:DNA helicase/exodeoxyribonuclease V alpha subunit [Pasteurella langaaensis DSM 22999]|uniref:RecBCD enzyme subunit RecD n=1 Tax=Alitibacter langaaensis DSM 22999 TaxID=1122935 RepID=A0A2U0SKN0_9PAST|nr:exodeoxyribonuclease V subunit alpha [Pasteurella langaaensis]PVX31901.1 DNA helicase/exodeoxyribonuclease V alpha subunit [Pasteurella langaaensis DSM 22999]